MEGIDLFQSLLSHCDTQMNSYINSAMQCSLLHCSVSTILYQQCWMRLHHIRSYTDCSRPIWWLCCDHHDTLMYWTGCSSQWRDRERSYSDLALNGMAVWSRTRTPHLSGEKTDALPLFYSYFTHSCNM